MTKLRQLIQRTFNCDIHKNTLANLGKSIESGNTNDSQAYGFAWSIYALDGNPKPHLERKYTPDKASEIMEKIEMDEDFGEELKRNILYIACVWAHDAKTLVADKRTYETLAKVIDAIARTAVQHWTLEPIFDQSSVPGVQRRTVGNVCQKLVQVGILKVHKQSTGQGISNSYKIATSSDYTPDQIRAIFISVHLTTDTADDQIDEFITQASVAVGSQPAVTELGKKKYDW